MVQLILLRHGESIWKRDYRFTGWTGVDLSRQGRRRSASGGGPAQDARDRAGLVLHVVSQARHPHIVDRSR
ncbi:MAG: histidine phosphatase family protein [Stellaceae bacterium]